MITTAGKAPTAAPTRARTTSIGEHTRALKFHYLTCNTFVKSESSIRKRKARMSKSSVSRCPLLLCCSKAMFFVFHPFFEAILNHATVHVGSLSAFSGPSFTGIPRPSRNPCSAFSSSHRSSYPSSTSSTRVGVVLTKSSSASSRLAARICASVSSRFRTVFSRSVGRVEKWQLSSEEHARILRLLSETLDDQVAAAVENVSGRS